MRAAPFYQARRAAPILWPSASSAYAQGSITFTSGVNAGKTATIKWAGSGALQLAYPLLNAPAPGDSFIVYKGCDHTMGTCQAKFNNLGNFRGFPFIPPPTSRSNVGRFNSLDDCLDGGSSRT